MPQPLSRVKRNAQIHVSPSAVQMQAQFQEDILKVIVFWAHIDGNIASLFSTMLKSDIEVGTAVYQAFNGLEARRIALFAAAEKALPEWQRIAIEAVWKATKQSRIQRDKFCHHVWGYSQDIPKALLLMDPSVVVDTNVSYRQQVSNRQGAGSIILPKDFDRTQIFVYREADFTRAHKDAAGASWLFTLLYYAVGARGNEKGRRQLLSEPAFQQAVQPLILGKSLELQAQLTAATGDHPPKGTWDHL
jgi:hypothetical protein